MSKSAKKFWTLPVAPGLRTRRLAAERRRHSQHLRDREAELERLSRRLDLALDASRVGVWDYAIGGSRLVWDARMDELYGYPPRAGGHSYADWRDRLHPEDLARAEAEFREAIEVTGRYDSHYRLVLPDGTIRHIRAIGAVYREDDGAKIVGVNWDVTAEVQRAAELEAKRLRSRGDVDRQVAVPGDDEPRDPHPDERRHRHARPDPAHRARPRRSASASPSRATPPGTCWRS